MRVKGIEISEVPTLEVTGELGNIRSSNFILTTGWKSGL